MHVHITKWGNSLGVRIPQRLAQQLGIHAGTPVEVSIEDHHLVIKKEYSLDVFLDQITLENTHDEYDLGSSHGKEVW